MRNVSSVLRVNCHIFAGFFCRNWLISCSGRTLLTSLSHSQTHTFTLVLAATHTAWIHLYTHCCGFTVTFVQTTSDADNLFPSFIIHLSPLCLLPLHSHFQPSFTFPVFYWTSTLDHVISFLQKPAQIFLWACSRFHLQYSSVLIFAVY